MKKENWRREAAPCVNGMVAWTRGACAQPIQPDLRRASRPPHPEPSPAPTWPPLFNHTRTTTEGKKCPRLCHNRRESRLETQEKRGPPGQDRCGHERYLVRSVYVLSVINQNAARVMRICDYEENFFSFWLYYVSYVARDWSDAFKCH